MVGEGIGSSRLWRGGKDIRATGLYENSCGQRPLLWQRLRSDSQRNLLQVAVIRVSKTNSTAPDSELDCRRTKKTSHAIRNWSSGSTSPGQGCPMKRSPHVGDF
jgi:hypothetical protein